MLKKLLSVLLTLVMLLSMIPVGLAADIEIVDEPEEDLIPIVEEEAAMPQAAEPQGDSSVVYRALLVGEVSFSFETAARNRGDTELIRDMLANTVGPEGNQYLVTTALDLSCEGILNKISSTFAGADANDVSLFFLATHGATNIASGPYAGALVTIETPGSEEGWLFLEELAESLKAVPGKVIVVLGSCGSGAAIVPNGAPGSEDLRFTEAVISCFESADEHIFEPGADEPQTGEFRSNKFYVLTAAAHMESSWGQESYTPYNFFPYYFAEGANTGMPADSSNDGLVTLDEMYQYCYVNAYGPYYDGTDNYYQHVQVYPENSSYPLFRNPVVDSGQGGDNLIWALNGSTLTISGTGDMWNFGYNSTPWYEYRSSIVTVDIQDGATSIGRHAFYDCTKLTSVTIPEGVTSIGKLAFGRCWSLQSLTIPESVKSIQDQAFFYCTGLTSIMIPAGVTSIAGNAFELCSALEAIIVAGGNQNYQSLDGVLLTKDGAMLICCPAGKTGDYVIPAGVKTIREKAFDHCSGLTSLYFEGSAPAFGASCCSGVTATAYYPANDPTWTSDVMQNYGGTITWVPYGETADEYTITLTDKTKGAAQTSIDFTAKYSGVLTFTVSADSAVLVAVKNGDEYMVLPCTTVSGEHSFTLNVTGDTEIALAFKGDVNLDGSLDLKDSLWVKKYVAGDAGQIGDQIQLLAGDVNADGSVNLKDLLAIKKAIAGSPFAW